MTDRSNSLFHNFCFSSRRRGVEKQKDLLSKDSQKSTTSRSNRRLGFLAPSMFQSHLYSRHTWLGTHSFSFRRTVTHSLGSVPLRTSVRTLTGSDPQFRVCLIPPTGVSRPVTPYRSVSDSSYFTRRTTRTPGRFHSLGGISNLQQVRLSTNLYPTVLGVSFSYHHL